MAKFNLKTKLKPTGDQPQAIEKLSNWINEGTKDQTLLGVTGSGKTFTMANVIEKVQKPTIIISHNKTLASQLYQEFRSLFPENAVQYFVSYYDYYQPEAYLPYKDLYIEKDAQINDEIDRLRHGATEAILSRDDVIIVASVSCIYNIGSPDQYEKVALELEEGQEISREKIIKKLTSLQYDRVFELIPGTFRVRGDTIDIFPPAASKTIRIELWGNKIEKISPKQKVKIYPARHFVTPQDKLEVAISNIEKELGKRLKELKSNGKDIEAHRLEKRTKYDMEMLREVGYCKGVENYTRHLSFKEPGAPPDTLLDYFPDDYLMIIDESHMTIPQIRGMYNGDRARKENLVEHGFRLPSALDNRPLKFEEFRKRINQVIYSSATPGEHEIKKSKTTKSKEGKGRGLEKEFDPEKDHIAEQLIRPTGIPDPKVEVRPSEGDIEDIEKEIKKRIEKNERVLVTTLTKKFSENLTSHLEEQGISVSYLHSEIDTLERPKIINDLRRGEIDVIVGINLLREGLDLPEVSLVIILDADKIGFLRDARSLIQTMGRAARHVDGKTILYADEMTEAMEVAIEETRRRRKTQIKYNKENNITPEPIEKEIADSFRPEDSEIKEKIDGLSKKEIQELMLEAAENLEFEKAAKLRDKLKELEKK